MTKNLTHVAAWLLAFAAFSASASDFTVMGGLSQFVRPVDGKYWNVNQASSMDLNPLVFALRYNTKQTEGGFSAGLQYTNFGRIKSDAWAVIDDAPTPGGYIGGGKCAGPCNPVARWIMTSDTQSVALIVTKHFDGFSVELGRNFYEVSTSGRVQFANGSTWNYLDSRYPGADWMAGVAYTKGPWSIRFQAWLMETRVLTDDGRVPPAVYDGPFQYTLLLGYTM